jgi:hypothetical protein
LLVVFNRASAITACSEEFMEAAISLGAPDHVQLIAWGLILTFNPSNDQTNCFRYGLNKDHSSFRIGSMVYKKDLIS